jgi:diguanylate cyclase (GGDEF)-like protein
VSTPQLRDVLAPRPQPLSGESSALARAGRGPLRLLRQWLPRGQLLPEHLWRRRHTTIVALVWMHAVGLTLFGLSRGQTLPHMLLEGGVIAALAALAGSERVSIRLRVAAAAAGLITSSAVLVHLWGGVVEAHFHFFVMIGVLTLYQDWLPLLVAIGYVVIHHGVGGALASASVYNHAAAIAHPWRWALIHGLFVLSASAVHLIAWRTNENQLLRDPLTGLPSRLLFLNRLSVALESLQRRRDRRVAVLFLDLDRFKVVNDSLGHAAGDALLLAVSERLREAVRRHETIARFGGDEFAILCEDVADEKDAVAIAERILESLARPFRLPHGEAATSASIGIALGADPDEDGDDLIRDADAAMYRAKQAGGGRWKLFDEVTRQRALDRLHTENALRQAIERDQLRVVFQPELALRSGAIVGVEALVRWQHPERGLLAPADFLALAEETGLIVPIDRWVLREACRHAHGWQSELGADAPLILRVNVSARQLARGGLADAVAAILAETGMEPGLLCLEVTESALMEDAECSRRTLAALKELGVRIAVDDFGAGCSSLENLRRFPLDDVKIDRSFVQGLAESEPDAAIVGAVIELGHALGLSVTAEGIETGAQLERLLAAGCDTAQGFLLGRPERPEAVARRLFERSGASPGSPRRPHAPGRI